MQRAFFNDIVLICLFLLLIYRMDNSSKRSLAERNISPELVESKEQPSEEFIDVCKKLDENIDSTLLNKAWKQFDTVGQQYVLEVRLSSFLLICSYYGRERDDIGEYRRNAILCLSIKSNSAQFSFVS